ncbi:hypothetical protein KG091_07690, partial [Carnobacteriaceae bacterium zg-ZUI78]|nr:hypothetical protein [Carnobacteriaceae bacterium zg-ZUI78]
MKYLGKTDGDNNIVTTKGVGFIFILLQKYREDIDKCATKKEVENKETHYIVLSPDATTGEQTNEKD